MELGRTLYVKERKAWRAWLRKNHAKEKEIWLVYPKKHTGMRRIPYNDAVEEALCFGWIDSTSKSIDGGRYAQRFTPRNPKTKYSQANIERLRELAKKGKVTRPVLAAVSHLLGEEKLQIPPDILREIKSNADAWGNFQKFSDRYKRIRIAYIDGARGRPEEFRRRLRNFIKMSARNRQFGFGGIKKYY